ncbi:MAG: hypothetical protein ACJ8CF_00375 [Microvirga sp.]
MNPLKIRAGEFAILARHSFSERAVGAKAGEGRNIDALLPLADARVGELIPITFDPVLVHDRGWRTEPRID